MTDLDLDPFARVHVSDHARLRIRERIGSDFPDGDVRAEVRIGLLAGRAVQTRPHWTHGDNYSREGEETGAWYVYDKDATRCWVVEPGREGRRAIVVKTLLLSGEEEARIGETKHVRRGSVRR